VIGKAVSHYRILEKLGGGGMGVVYKAEDTKLGRMVALKVLPPERVADPNRKRRFVQEARAASALNHPNIIVIHDIDEAEGVHYIAMEHVEGKTLDRLIARHGLRVNEALKYAVQMAAALAKAHAAGIVHRDLKPTNVMVTDDGLVKVLDFGLAKLTEAAPTGETETAVTLEPTTEEGTIVGTVGYMSPEQAEGKPVDARSDIFSFGSVLYEMLTGQRAFQGETKVSTIAAILREEPKPLSQVVEGLPREVERIVKRCLRKDPAHRFQHMDDLKVALEELKEESDSGELAATPKAEKKGFSRTALAAIVVAGLVTIAAVLAYWLTRPPAPPPELKERRLTFNPSENAVTQGVISPDGKYLAYGDTRGMHVKLIQTGETLNIPQPQGPAPDPGSWWPNGWFPDSTKFIAAGIESAGQRVSGWVVSVMGGPPRKLRDDADPWSVSPDGTLIAFGTGLGFSRWREIWLMGPQGEEPRRLVSGSEDDNFFWAAWSPDGQRIAYDRYHRTPDTLECSIESRDLKGSQPTLILSDQRFRASDNKSLWYPGGRFIYAMNEPEPNQGDTNLWEIRVDTRTGKPIGKPRRITNWAGVSASNPSGTADGKQLAVSKYRGQWDVYVGELEANGHRLKNPRRLTLDEHDDYPGGWMPDSKAVLFLSDRNGTWDIFKQALDQAEAQPVVTGPDYKDWPVVSPDGSWILYLSRASPESSATTSVRIMRVPTSGGPQQLVLEGRGIDYLACARSPAALCVFSEPSPDRKQLIFSAFDPSQEGRRELTRVNLKQPVTGYGWDLSLDGSHLAFAQSDEREGRIQIPPLAGGEVREINVKGWNGLWRLFWAADGRGLFVSAAGGQGATLLYVDLEGRGQVIWQQRFPGVNFEARGIPSPDGRYLAVLAYATDSDVWLLGNF
jgi:serine/threonine protein kinase/Tol biopolymer transport system component